MTPHVLVLGAGIVGAAIAFRLARAGARVTVIEARGVASGATGASFGWINASFFANPAHFHLRQAGIAAHRALDADLGETGTLWQSALWYEAEGDAFDAQAANLTALGYPLREIGRAEFAAFEPHVANPPDRALLFTAEGATDPARLTHRLLEGAAAQGAQLWQGVVATGLVTQGGRVTGIRTDQGVLVADHIVLATGTATEGLLAGIGVALPMLSRPGVLFRTQSLPPLLRHILIGPDAELRQEPSGHLLAPAEAAHQTHAAEALNAPPGALADSALARLNVLLPGQGLVWQRVMVGHRPIPADGLPAVGKVAPGLSVAVMHSGVTLAPLIGELVASEVLRGGDSPLLARFRPGRFTPGLQV